MSKLIAIKQYLLSGYVRVIARWAITAVVVAASVILYGCGTRTVVEYQPYPIPVPCITSIPTKPAPTDDPIETNLLILQYVEQCEIELRRCTNAGVR